MWNPATMHVPDGHKLLYSSIDGSRTFRDKDGNTLPAQEAMILVEDTYDIPSRSNRLDHDASRYTVDASHELVDDEEFEQDLLATHQLQSGMPGSTLDRLNRQLDELNDLYTVLPQMDETEILEAVTLGV